MDSGLVGGNFARALPAQGRPIRAVVDHDRRALDGLDVETVRADLADPAHIRPGNCSCFRGQDSARVF